MTEAKVLIHFAVTVAVAGSALGERYTLDVPVASVRAHAEESVPTSIVKVTFAPETGLPLNLTTVVIVDCIDEFAAMTPGDAAI